MFDEEDHENITFVGMDEDILMVKRIIAMPHEIIRIEGSNIYIDGDLLEEPYAKYSGQVDDDLTIELKEDEFFIMGDNREHSKDSRHFGPVLRDDIRAVIVRVKNP